MVDSTEQEKSGGDGTLIIGFATVLGSALHEMISVPLPEALLLGYTVSYVIGYRVPPRSTIGFFRWVGERIALIVVVYTLVLRGPSLLARSMNVYLAYGIGILITIMVYYLWRQHSKGRRLRG